jgi:hypothetical protein
MQSQFLAEKQKLMMELSDLQVEKIELQVFIIDPQERYLPLQMQAERAIREKRAVENETYKIRESIPLEIERMNLLINEMQEKLRRCERERDEAMYQVER